MEAIRNTTSLTTTSGRAEHAGPWAARFALADAPAVAAFLRLRAGVTAAIVNPDELWLRGDAIDESLDRALRSLAPIARYALSPANDLIPHGRLLPVAALPAANWTPLQSFIEIDRPTAALPGTSPAQIAITLVHTHIERATTMLKTNLRALVAYAETAPAVRLRPLHFAATAEHALILGQPLPPLPGLRLWSVHNIAIPCGFDWSPPVDAITLRRALWLEDDTDVALFAEDGSWQLVPAGAFVAATRSAIRLTARRVTR